MTRVIQGRAPREGWVRPEAIPLRHPAFIGAAIVAAACIVVSASYVLYDTDLWQHLAFGKAIWSLREIPRTSQWSWPQLGEPQVVSSWAFRVLLWPIWSAGGVTGLYLFRWATTLGLFALLWATARVMGARGLLTLLVLVWCGLVYRLRTDLRAEVLAGPLFALELWILERRRQAAAGAIARRAPAASREVDREGHRRKGSIDPGWAVVPIAWAWANVHVSYYVGLLVLAFYLLDRVLERRRARVSKPEAGQAHERRGNPSGSPVHRHLSAPPEPLRPAAARDPLAVVALVAVAVSFLHPSGWRALWQPFEFLIYWRNDPLFRAVGEFHPLPWRFHLRSGLPLLMLAWPALIALRVRQRGLDRVELLCCTFFSFATLSAQRFASLYAIAAAPFVARDLAERASGWRLPRMLAAAWPRAALTAAAAVLIALPEWTRRDLPLGIGIDPTSVPAAACDFMASQGIQGRGFNELQLGGYLLYRFWPDRGRLPFINTQPEYTSPEDRRLYIGTYSDPGAWRELDRRHRFDYVLLERNQSTGSHLLDFLDQDSAWAMVFTDDAAELLVRVDGPLRQVAERTRFRVLPAGERARTRLVGRCEADPILRAQAERELQVAVASSERNGSAHHLLGLLMLMDDRPAEARSHLERALRLSSFRSVHELLGRIALAEGRPGDAVRELIRERALYGPSPGLELRLGQAYARLGDAPRARAAYRRELARDAENTEARDSLAAATARTGGGH